MIYIKKPSNIGPLIEAAKDYESMEAAYIIASTRGKTQEVIYTRTLEYCKDNKIDVNPFALASYINAKYGCPEDVQMELSDEHTKN